MKPFNPLDDQDEFEDIKIIPNGVACAVILMVLVWAALMITAYFSI